MNSRPIIFSSPKHPSSAGRGFTLTEMLIVIAIIVLLIALALPAFSFLTGSRSVEAATNLASSTLGIARANAVGLQQPQGVIFYRDAATDRMAMALVEVRTTPFTPWVGWTAGSPITHTQGEYVATGGVSYVCIQSFDDASGTTPSTDTAHWRAMPSAAATNLPATTTYNIIEAVANTERQLLPLGVNARTAGNAVVDPNSTNTYRYFSPGVVLFDGNGLLAVQNYMILPEGIIGQQLDPKKNAPDPYSGKPFGWKAGAAGADPTTVLSSHIGLAFFSDEQFTNATSGAGYSGNQGAIDDWIDQNGTPVMLNRYNGTLVKGE